MTNNLSQYCPSRSHRKLMAWCCFFVFLTSMQQQQVLGAYQGDSDKWSHWSDPYMSLRSDTAATSSRPRPPSRFCLQDGTETYKLCSVLPWWLPFVKLSQPNDPCRQTDAAQISVYSPKQWAAPALLYKGFFFLFHYFFLTRQLITSNLTSVRRDWTITCVCGILQLPRAR